MKMKAIQGLFAVAALSGGLVVGGNAVALMVGSGEATVVGELTTRGNVRVAQEATGLQLDVSNTRYAFFSGDGIATGPGAYAMLDLETGGSIMFPESTAGAVGVENGRIATVVESGSLCFGAPDASAGMVIVRGPYTFSIEDAGSGFMSTVDDAIQVNVVGGVVTVRDPSGEIIALLGPGEGSGFSISEPGTAVPAVAVDDPCTRRGFAWHGPQAPIAAGPPLYVPPAPAVLTTGGAVAGGLVFGIAAGVAGGAIVGSDSDPSPASP